MGAAFLPVGEPVVMPRDDSASGGAAKTGG
jgi:hypothetical protein